MSQTQPALLIMFACTTAFAEPPNAEKAPPHPLVGSFIAVKITGGFTPYRLVSYDVMWRGRVAVASHYRALVNYSEALHRMRLVPTARYEALFDALEAAGAFELETVDASDTAPGTLVYELEVKRGDKKHHFRVTGLRRLRDPRYAAVLDEVRRFVVERAGDVTFRNVFFEPGTFGYVNLTSVPVARIWVDGRDIGRSTPVYGYELPAGAHEVRLVAKKQGWERKHTLRVEPGMTTIVHFDLR